MESVGLWPEVYLITKICSLLFVLRKGINVNNNYEISCNLYTECKPVLHTDMVTWRRTGRPLFPLGVQHFHEERLRGGAAVAVFVVQVFFSSRRKAVDFGQKLLHLMELVLKSIDTLVCE